MAKTDFKTSLIIVNYNGFEITKNCLNSIFANTANLDFETIVVDNASEDRSLERLKEEFADKENFFVLGRTKNDFLTAAYNDGAKLSRGEILIFMNNDLVLDQGCLAKLIKAFDQEKTGVAGAAMFSFKEKEVIDNLGCQLNFLGYGKRIAPGKKMTDGPAFSEVSFVPGSLLAVSRNLFDKIGGFDETYGGNYEDADFCWQARSLGYKTVVARKAKIYHLGSWTVKQYLNKTGASYLCRKNHLATLLKNAGTLHLILILPLYFSLQIFLFLKELILERNSALAMTTPRAVFWNLKNLETIFAKRRQIQIKTRSQR